jgi:acyl dehydratase
MTESLITPELKAAIGVESEPSVYEIGKEAIRRWAEAIGDPNPLYHDEAYARKLGYRSLIAPPEFLPHYGYPVKKGISKTSIQSPLKRNLAGGNEIEIFQPLQAGDIVYQTNKLTEVLEKEGRLGKMLILITENTVRNTKGELVSRSRHTEITY